ncbi:MAG: glycosyltransferase family 4 protein, partial [Terrimicrobiaceae bacterium]
EFLRAQLNIPSTQPLILFVGRFVEKKGIRLLEAIVRSNSSSLFIFVGGGPLNPSSWNLPNVRIHPPMLHRELRLLYQAANVLVLPAVGEGFPLVVQEAMCCGLPAIVSDEIAEACPEMSGEFLTAGPAGINTAEVLEPHLRNPYTEAIRKNLADKAAPLWSWETCGNRYYELFLKILNKAS